MTNTPPPPARSQSTGNGAPRRQHASVQQHRGRGGRLNSNAGRATPTGANATGAAVPRGRVEAVFEELQDKNVVVEAVGVLTAEARECSRRQRLHDQLRRARRLRDAMENAVSEAEGSQERARNMLLRHREDINELVSLTEAVRGGYTLDSYDHYTVVERRAERKREEAIREAKLIVLDQLREMAEERSPALKVLNRAQRSFDEAMRPTVTNVNESVRDPMDEKIGAATAIGVSCTMKNYVPRMVGQPEAQSPKPDVPRQVLPADSHGKGTKHKKKKKRSPGEVVDKSEKQKKRKKRKKKLDLSPDGDASVLDSSPPPLRPMPAESPEQSLAPRQKSRVEKHRPKQDHPVNDRTATSGEASVESPPPSSHAKDLPPSPSPPKKDPPARPLSPPSTFGNRSPNHKDSSPQIHQKEHVAGDISPSFAAGADKTTSRTKATSDRADSGTAPAAASLPKKRRRGGAVGGGGGSGRSSKELKARKCHDCKGSSTTYHRCQFWNMNGTKCGKAYCSTCLTTRYDVGDFEAVRGNDEWFCPACLGKCLCRPCVKERERVERRTAHNATRRSAARVSDKFYAQFG